MMDLLYACGEDDGFTLDGAGKAYFSEPGEENLVRVVQAGQRLIRHFIRLYGSGFPREDLLQAGTEGILKALKRYDAERGAGFATFAGGLIISEIRHYVRREARYYYPQTVMRLQDKLNAIVSERLAKTGMMPSSEEIAGMLNIKEDGVSELMRSGLMPIEEIDIRKIASARYETFKLPIEERILLEQSLKRLSDLQRKVIELIFFRDMTQEQVASRLGMNQRRVSRLKCTGIEYLRHRMSE